MSELLARLTAESRRRAREAKSRVSEAELLRRAARRPEPPKLRLDGFRFDVLAEIKPRSPSSGSFGSSLNPADRALIYQRAGAAAVSVVTEPTAFGGSLEDLEAAARCGVPVMRKDFLVDPYQIVEARAHGAAGVLLIVRCLDDALLAAMRAAAHEMGLFVLHEAFDARDLDRVAGAALVGINARDLSTLELDGARHAVLVRRIPAGVPAVAESGVATPAAAARVAALGYRAALAGSALMALDDPGPLLADMIAAGRDAAGARAGSP